MDEELLAKANAMCQGTLFSHLGMELGLDGQGRFTMTMPVDDRTKQPHGILHGGATAALAESLGSLASSLIVQDQGKMVVGISLTVNHIRPVPSGLVTGTAELLHEGRTTHVWDVRVRNASGQLVAVCRMTNMIRDERP